MQHNARSHSLAIILKEKIKYHLLLLFNIIIEKLKLDVWIQLKDFGYFVNQQSHVLKENKQREGEILPSNLSTLAV